MKRPSLSLRGVLGVLALACACEPTLNDTVSVVTAPQLLAVRAGPEGGEAEAAPLGSLEFSGLYVDSSGPIVPGRIIDLSYGAAQALQFKQRGLQRVRLDLVASDPRQPRPGQSQLGQSQLGQSQPGQSQPRQPQAGQNKLAYQTVAENRPPVAKLP